MFCNKCGNPLADDAKFCTECGGTVEAVETIENKAESTESVVDAVEEKADEAADAKQPSAAEAEPEVIAAEEDEPDKTENTAAEALTQQAVSLSSEEVSAGENDAIISPLPDQPLITELPQEVQREEPKAHKKLRAGNFAGASIISVFLIVFTLLFNLLLSSRLGFGSAVLPDTVRNMSFENLLDTKISEEQTLTDYIYNNLEGKFVTVSEAEKQDVRSLILGLELRSFMADKLEAYAAYLVDGSGTKDPSVNSDDIVDYIRGKEAVFAEELEFYMNESDYNEIDSSLENMNLDEKLSIKHWSDVIGVELSNARFIFSYITIGVVFAIILVLYIWIAIVLDKKGRHVMGFFGNATLISGLITFIPAAVFCILSAYAALYTGTTIVFLCAQLLCPFACFAAAIGAAEIIVAIIFKKVKKFVKKKEFKAKGGN